MDKLDKKWKQWKNENNPRLKENLLAELLDDLEPVIEKKTREYITGAQLTPEVIKTAALPLVLQAIHTYNPQKGAKLSTYVNIHLKHLRREMAEIQNIGRMPEQRSIKVPQYQAVLHRLTEQLGREPSIDELAQELGWPYKEVARLQNELQMSDIPMFASMESEFGPQLGILTEDDANLVNFLYESLSPTEQFVLEHTIGRAGAPIYSVQEIAKRLKKTPAQIYKIRNQIGKKLAEYKYSQLPQKFVEPSINIPQPKFFSTIGEYFDAMKY